MATPVLTNETSHHIQYIMMRLGKLWGIFHFSVNYKYYFETPKLPVK